MTVSGLVRDAQRTPVPFATVVLLAPKDSALIQTGQADGQGEYQLNGVRAGMYRVLATAVGFEKERSDVVPVADRNVRMPDLVLKPAVQALGAVEVMGRKRCWKWKRAR